MRGTKPTVRGIVLAAGLALAAALPAAVPAGAASRVDAR